MSMESFLLVLSGQNPDFQTQLLLKAHLDFSCQLKSFNFKMAFEIIKSQRGKSVLTKNWHMFNIASESSKMKIWLCKFCYKISHRCPARIHTTSSKSDLQILRQIGDHEQLSSAMLRKQQRLFAKKLGFIFIPFKSSCLQS